MIKRRTRALLKAINLKYLFRVIWKVEDQLSKVLRIGAIINVFFKTTLLSSCLGFFKKELAVELKN